ncbi:hypothetical protein M5D96_002471, partial [Drosophila gunungcola]
KRQKIENAGANINPKQKKVKAKGQEDGGYGSGEFSLDWDVDSYRTEYESEEHWDLRRSFMLAHKERFEEDRLTFVNMEFMGCKYPSETMRLVAEMSKEIAEEFRRKRDQRLKRTFVSASDAAEQRAKGRRAAAAPAADSAKDSSNRFTRERLCFGGGEPIDLFQGLRYGPLILYLAGGRSCLRNSCTTVNMKYEERASQDQPLNATRETIKVEKSKNGVNINVTKESADSLGDPKLDASNKGYRMMRLMGWAGGGLGRLKQGREEPVGYLLKSNRNGLGSINPQGNLADYRKLIENYVKSDDLRDMQFEPTFSKEERASFHQMASRFGLKSSSYGTGETRRLLITKKVSYSRILTEVLCGRNPKFCERYFVQVPMQKAHLFPGHVAGLELENMSMTKCPRCNCEATGENRLVTDSCGHMKCRLCLVADVSDCLECRIASEESARTPKQQESKAITSADKRIVVTDRGYHCTRFATRSHLKYHLSSHAKLPEHSCNACGKRFKQPVVLQRHMLTHSQEQHVCPHCEKVFRRKSSLKSHLAIHTDLGLPYKCELCSKNFQNKANLNQHLRKHDKNSIRHKCKICQKSFLRQTTLRLHMKRHSNRQRLSCSLCGKSYNDADALGRHLKQHKGVERFRCMQCEITVNRKDNMLRHLRSMHPGCAFDSSVEIVTPGSRALEATAAVERPVESVRYNSVIQSVGNVEPVMLPPQPALPLPLPEMQLDPADVVTEHLPLPDVMPEKNVQLYRKIILDLDNEEYTNELSLDETQESTLQQRQPCGPGQGSSKFSGMHWRKNFKCWYENEHTN